MGSLARIQHRRVIKIIKRVKDFSYRERLVKLGLIIILERRSSHINETFKIINGIFNPDRYFRKYFFSN